MDEAAPAPPGSTPTLLQESLLVGVSAAVVSAAIAGVIVLSPGGKPDGRSGPVQFLVLVAGIVGQGGWITLDRKRRGREVGVWRWAAILFGPLTICIYLAAEYGAKALLLIPICLAIYAVTFGTGTVVGILLSNAAP